MLPELNRIYLGDCLTTLRAWPDACVDAVVTDPPYELGFMGKKWDSTGVAFRPETWAEVLRVMKPGAHLLAFGGTRTYHRMACAIEDAGFEIRDMVSWMYGEGFPKSLDIAKALDKQAGHWRGRAGAVVREDQVAKGTEYERTPKGEPVTAAAAAAWAGWGTALKPALEPVVLARKPISEKNVAANVLKWGTGAINIDASRIGDLGGTAKVPDAEKCSTDSVGGYLNAKAGKPIDAGRWPANVILDPYAAGYLDAKTGNLVSGAPAGVKAGGQGNAFGTFAGGIPVTGFGDQGGASRFFYCAKPDNAERNMGLGGKPKSGGDATGREDGSAGLRSPRAGAGRTGTNQNFHPTVKPVDLMAYLVKLVTPPQGVVLDPFIGSGTTGIAAARLGHPFLGCELSPEYLAIAEKRIAPELAQGKLL